MSFQAGDDPNRHSLTDDDRAKGRLKQTQDRLFERHLRVILEREGGAKAIEMAEAIIARAIGVQVQKRTKDGPTIYKEPPNVEAFKAIRDTVDGLITQRIQIDDVSDLDDDELHARTAAAFGRVREAGDTPAVRDPEAE